MLFPLVFGLGTYVAPRAQAQTFTNLHNFSGTDGASPQGGLILSNNTLYGATAGGGAYSNGTVFAMNTDGTGFTNLHSFTTSDGIAPVGRLVLSGNTLYGTASGGGQWGSGTVFAVNTNGGGFRVLHSFTSVSNYANGDGAAPSGGLVLWGNTLYGATQGGGEFGQGTIFAINTNATSVSGITILHNFTPRDGFPGYFTNSDGANPNGALVLSGHTLYGTASGGGRGGWGTVFAMNTDGTDFETLHSFPGVPYSPEGAYPNAGVVLWGNTLYGQAFYGGISGDEGTTTFNGIGTVFAVNTDGTSFTVLHAFSPYGAAPYDCPITNSDGARPIASLIVSGNTLYGPTTTGGSGGYGTVFKVNTDGTDFNVLNAFTSAGVNPFNAPLTKEGNILYSSTVGGGSAGVGTLFRITLPELELSIAVSGPNVILSWPTNFSGSTLQFATDLAPPVWNVNLSPSVVVNGQYTVTNPVSAKQKFYRLRQ